MTPDETLAAMLTAWREDIDSVPFPDFDAAVLRGERSPGHDLSSF